MPFAELYVNTLFYEYITSDFTETFYNLITIIQEVRGYFAIREQTPCLQVSRKEKAQVKSNKSFQNFKIRHLNCSYLHLD